MNDPRHPVVPGATHTIQPNPPRPIAPAMHPAAAGHPAPTLRPAVQPPHLPQPSHSQPHISQPGLHPVRPVVTPPRSILNDEPLALVEELPELEENTVPAPSKIKFGPDTTHKTHEWKRKPHLTGQGACRVKTFHAKYSDQGLEHIDDQINEWLDAHAEVEIKFVTTTVHVFEGKIREPAIVMNLWY
jgi:hypothetical protein